MKSFTAITTHSQLFNQTFLSLRFKKTEKKQRKTKQNKTKREKAEIPTIVFT